MDSALRPRDIQARIRAGETPDEVAAAAGVPVERIDAFAAPVLAERDHVAGLARTHPVRRRGETASHRLLRVAVAEHLAQRGVDADTVEWDAWKLEDRRWRVRARFQADSERVADFTYDQAGRFTVAANDEARLIVGELTATPQAAPQADDQLALVRAVQSPAEPEAEPSGPVATVTPLPPPVPEQGEQPAAPAEPSRTAPDAAGVQQEEQVGDADASDDSRDAYVEGELAEVDGVVEIVPASDTDLDVLYDMLSSFDEDSVKIYAGLVQPLPDSLPGIVAGPDPEPEPDQEAAPEPEPEPEPRVEAATEEPGATAEPDVAAEDVTPPQTRTPTDTQTPTDTETPTEAPQPRTQTPEPPAPAEPEQLSLIDDVEPPAPRPKPRRKRASVPSWDEIVFGGPTTPRSGD